MMTMMHKLLGGFLSYGNGNGHQFVNKDERDAKADAERNNLLMKCSVE